jgi:hypothetical protein
VIAFILLCIAVMLIGAIVGRPIGWVALGLALLALVLQLGVTAR